MPLGGPPAFAQAVWVGELADDDPRLAAGAITLTDGDGFTAARLLIRSGVRCRGFVDLAVASSQVDGVALRSAVAELPRRSAVAEAPGRPGVTVTISTRNRADQLALALNALAALTYPNLEILIVDNASTDDATEKLVLGCTDERFRYVREERVGLSYGRNRALVEANTPIVAFTDDDTIVDRAWVDGLVEAFEAADDVAVVTGMVPTGELRTPSQLYFEQQTHWQQICLPRTFRASTPPADIRSFPLDVGRYGTGANFAVRREIAIRLGGFNEALGIGSPTHGGEDLDMFLRALYGGFGLTYAPDAIVWHRHRADAEELEKAVRGYGISFGAWMTSLIENPSIRRDALRIGGLHALRRVRERVGGRGSTVAEPTFDGGLFLTEHGFTHLPGIALRTIALGPSAYVRSRRSGRRSRPLLGERG